MQQNNKQKGHVCDMFFAPMYVHTGPAGSDAKESACNTGDPGLIPGLGRSPGEGNGYPVFMSGEFHEQRSLAGYSPWDQKTQLSKHIQQRVEACQEWSFCILGVRKILGIISSTIKKKRHEESILVFSLMNQTHTY